MPSCISNSNIAEKRKLEQQIQDLTLQLTELQQRYANIQTEYFNFKSMTNTRIEQLLQENNRLQELYNNLLQK